ncbi:MAG: hypothetical protein F6K24_25485, partial [Okeania sp. SIO2D1]|nr:hypothetical protein [Okeania sp. SIO2D1]
YCFHQKIEQARRLAETQDNFSDRYTYEELSQLTNLSLNTVIKIVGYEVPVDKQSLDCFFSAFNIVLERGDYTQPNNNISAPSIPPPDHQQPTFPGDPLTIDSLYYINRFMNGNNHISLE